MTTDPSPVENQDATAGAPEGSNEPAAQNGAPDVTSETTGQDSSTGQDSGAKPSTSLEAAKKAVEALGTAAESPTAKAGTEKRPAEGEPEGKPEDADKALPFHNHPRWKEVTTAKKALETEVEGLKPKAERWDALDAKFRETGMAPEDVDRLFVGGAMLKRAGVEPQEVDILMKVGAALKLGDREIFKQLASNAIEALGLRLVEALPPEIQEQIESGAITEDAGRRMANLEFETRREAALRARTEQQLTAREQADQAQSMTERISRASWSWEQKVKATDADWSRKEPFIVEAIKAQVARRPPQSESEVEAICQAAYDQVTRIMRSSAPATRPAVAPPRGNGSSTDNRPMPRSSLEAARLAIGR